MNIEHSTSSSPVFPGPDALCEACGYALKGLQPDGTCPECGLAITASSPAFRTGPLWHTRPGAQAAFNILIALTLNPNYFFRRMRVDGSNVAARLFLLIVAFAVGLTWFYAVWGRSLSRGDSTRALLQALIACGSVIVLSYIEAVGVVYFSRRRGWRVPFKLAERLVCYSSPGWLPAAGIMVWAMASVHRGDVDRWMGELLPAWEPWQSWALLVLVGAVAMLWFEVLVWLGVRQTKYANS